MVTWRFGWHSAQVAITVASVGPYVLKTRRLGFHHRLTNSGGQGSPPRISRRIEGTSFSSIASKVGTHERTVTPADCSMSAKAGPAWNISGVAGTRTAPEQNASQISSTEASKASENPW